LLVHQSIYTGCGYLQLVQVEHEVKSIFDSAL
jgi:hypothetical protein